MDLWSTIIELKCQTLSSHNSWTATSTYLSTMGKCPYPPGSVPIKRANVGPNHTYRATPGIRARYVGTPAERDEEGGVSKREVKVEHQKQDVLTRAPITAETEDRTPLTGVKRREQTIRLTHSLNDTRACTCRDLSLPSYRDHHFLSSQIKYSRDLCALLPYSLLTSTINNNASAYVSSKTYSKD